MPSQATLTYDGTKLHSGGAHVLRNLDAESAGIALEKFRLACTDVLEPTYVRVDLTNADFAPKSFVDHAYNRCEGLFGKPTADFGRRRNGTYNWFLPLPMLNCALQLIDELQPIPANAIGLGILKVCYKLDFSFGSLSFEIPPSSASAGDYLKFEAEHGRYLGQSYIEAEFSTKHRVSAFFSFPFQEWNKEAAAYIHFIQERLPFRMSEKRWKRWHLNKLGTGYVGRKISVAGLARPDSSVDL